MPKKKLLYITPHLSTGGLPQYLLKKIESFKDKFDIYVVEYQNLSGEYVVQKNKIKQLLGEHKLITLGANKHTLLSVIENINPDIIHFEEIPEHFVDHSVLTEIFNKKERLYYIIATTHSSYTDPSKIYNIWHDTEEKCFKCECPSYHYSSQDNPGFKCKHLKNFIHVYESF